MIRRTRLVVAIEYLTAETLSARRKELLTEVDISLAELRAREKAGTLDAEAHAALGELEDLEYLSNANRVDARTR